MRLDTFKVRDFATGYTAAWCSQNPAAVAEFFSPSGSLTINGGAAAVGRRSITEAAREFMTAFPDLKVSMDDLVFKDDVVEYRWTLTGTNSGPGGTGHGVTISGYEEWRFGNDGRIAKSLGHFDAADFQQQQRNGSRKSAT